MAISLDELRNGLAPAQDLVLPDKPEHPAMRESTSIWMFDEAGRFGFPRLAIETEASSWDDRLFQANFAFADGRVLDGGGRGPAPPAIGPSGRPVVLGAGPLSFQCIEPFRRWMVSFNGPAVETSVDELIAGAKDPSRRIPVRLEADMTMVTPAWTWTGEGESAEDEYIGLGCRFEHWFCAEGVFHVDGQDHEFTATGLRIHGQSIRRLEGFGGHCWQSALFPDGRAFGYIAWPPKPDGSQFNIGYIYQDGRMIPAKVAQAPWLRRVMSSGDDVSFELESELGRTRIEGSTTLSTFKLRMAEIGGLTLQQGGVRYAWDGQSAIGMIERSSSQDPMQG